MNKKTVLVTGGAGYIGSHACKSLQRAGFIPVTIDNLITGWREAVKFGPFEEADLLNKAAVIQVFKKYKPVAVMHFASLSQVGESVQKPYLYWQNNVMGSLNLIQAAVDNGCMNFVFSSTCAVYGDQDGVILDEYSEQNPKNAYGASKQAVEKILTNYQATYGLNHVIFRYFNVAGADAEAEIGEFHQPETHLIPLAIHAACAKGDALTIFGNDYDTSDGTCTRDYVHVCDLIDAHLLGLKWLQDGRGSRTFNLGTGEGFSVRDVVNQVAHVIDRPVPVIQGSRRKGDCAKLVSGSSRAVSELGWKPKRSDLKRMIKDAWRWHQFGSYNT